MEDVLKALQTKLWEVESKLSFTSCKSWIGSKAHILQASADGVLSYVAILVIVYFT